MHNHVTNKQLASYLAGTMLTDDRGRFDDHLHECPACNGKFEKIQIAIAPRFQAVELREVLIERILDSWDAIKAEAGAAGHGGIMTLPRRYPWTFAGSALAAAVAIAILVTAFLLFPQKPRGECLSLSRIEGEITLNGAPAGTVKNVYSGSRITISEKAIARLQYYKTINIDLVNKSDFSIDAFAANKAGRIRMLSTLRDGIVVSSIHDKDMNITYEYQTPNARIESMGTEFLLQADGGITLVIMKNDAIRATHTQSGKSMMLRAGSKCIISDSFDVRPATAEDMRIFDSLEMLLNGAYAHLLLPSIRPDPRRGSKDTGVSSLPSGDPESGGTADAGGNAKNANVNNQDVRHERDREVRQQRMEQRRLQMNEMRRNNRTNMNQQMRKGR